LAHAIAAEDTREVKQRCCLAASALDRILAVVNPVTTNFLRPRANERTSLGADT
jgi:hypothetical protein